MPNKLLIDTGCGPGGRWRIVALDGGGYQLERWEGRAALGEDQWVLGSKGVFSDFVLAVGRCLKEGSQWPSTSF